MRLRLPPRFYDDHVSRDLPGGVEVHRTKTYILADLTAGDLAELRDDAAYYVSEGGWMDRDHRGIVASARATLKAIDKAILTDSIKIVRVTDPEGTRYSIKIKGT